MGVGSYGCAAMNTEQQNIAIAESLGWKWNLMISSPYYVWLHPDGCACGSPGYLCDKEKSSSAVPDYTGDLNAIHDAEDHISESQWEVYAGHLAGMNKPLESFRFLTATAAQRSEAYLRTLGLWVE